jgi:hypothetical protein
MRKIFLFAFIAISFQFTKAQTLKTPAPSPTQTLKQDFALSSIEISYSRPGVKGRKIFGDLVPFGKVWRTGANSATTITFGDDVTIGGTLVKAGTYGLLTIPDKDNWTIIISNQTDVTSPAAYKPEEDVVRVNVKPYTLPYSEETFTINVYNIKDNSCTIGLAWDNQYAGFDVTTDIDSKIMADIKRTVEGDTRPYFQAAMYYMNNGKDLNQALTWFNKAAELQPTAYFIIHQQANCLAKLGKKEEAKAAAKKSMALAKEAKNDDYVRLNEKLLAELNK